MCSLCRLPPVLFLESCKAIRAAGLGSHGRVSYRFLMHIGQRCMERANATCDITMLGEASSQDTLEPTNHWIPHREFFYFLNPKCNLACCVLTTNSVHAACWASKCRYVKNIPVVSYLSISSCSSELKHWDLVTFFLRQDVNKHHFSLQEGLRNLSPRHHHLILYCTIVLYRNRVCRRNNSSCLQCCLYCQFSFHRSVFKSGI